MSTPKPELVTGFYPRAHPIEVFGREDGHCDFAFLFHGRWHRLPFEAVDHAAVEVGSTVGVYIDPLSYAAGVGLFLAALEKCGWRIVPSTPGCSNLYNDQQDC